MTDKEHGGARPGAGRKPIADAAMQVVMPVRMSREQRNKLDRLGVTVGGAGAWIREKIDKAKEPVTKA